MPLTLRVSDAADGTGAAAVLAGTGGAGVTVYARGFDHTYTTRAWESAGSRTGDGPLAMSLAPGFHWVYAEASATRSAVLAVQVTDGLRPLAGRCREAVAVALRLAVPAEFQPCVLIQFRYLSPAPSLPAVVLTADGLNETIDADLSSTDLIGFPVLVVAALADPPANGAMLVVDRVRQAVIDLFHRRRLAGVPECRDCTVEAVALDPDDPRTRGVTSGQLVRVYCRRQRPGGLA